MKIYVGIDPYHGRMAVFQIFNEQKRNIMEFNIKNVKEFITTNINSLFNDIKFKLPNATKICICIWLPEILKNYKENFIKMAGTLGFEKTEIVDTDKLECIETILQSNFKLNLNETLWLNYSKTLYIWKNGICEEKHFILYDGTLESLFNTTKFAPDVAIMDRENCNEKSINSIKNLFPNCKILRYENIKMFLDNRAQMALKYAQVMGDDIVLYKDDANAKLIQTSLKRLNQKEPIIDTLYKVEKCKSETGDAIFMDGNVDKLNTALLDTEITENHELKTKEILTESVILQNPTLTVPNTDKIFPIPKRIIAYNADVRIAGIDLGTSRCCLAINRNIEVITVPLDTEGERLLPSYVAFDEENVKCGRLVVKRLQYYSKSTVFDSKRIIGRNISNLEIDGIWPFNIIDNNGKILIEVRGPIERETKTAEKVSAELLKLMKQKAEQFHGQILSKVVITIPADFSESQKLGTLEAATLAGWKDIKLLPEPIAAAFAYFIEKPMPTKSTVLLFDLGGGTLDVCIFKYQNFKIQIISNIGDSKLGGRNFDTVLINYFRNVLDSEYGISTTTNEKKYKLMIECQKIKENLSILESTSLDVEQFDPSIEKRISISQEEFENMTKPLLNKIQAILDSALNISGFRANEIDKVLQVGGGSRMPMIKHLLQKTFPFAEQCCHKNPDEVVAIGAAYFAYSIFS